MVTMGILPHKENSHGWAGNRTWDLVISSQKLRPLDYEAGHLSRWGHYDVSKRRNLITLTAYKILSR